MSYVSINNSKHDIINKIDALMNKQLQPIMERISRRDVAHAALEDLYGKDEVDNAERMVPGVLAHFTQLHLSMPNGATWTFNMSPAQPLYNRWTQLGNPYGAHEKINEQNTPTAWALIKTDWELYTRITKEKEDLLEAIKQLLDQSKSLNEAVKVMPSLVDYVSDDVKKRLFDKGTGKKAVGEGRTEPVIPPEAIASLTKARMLNDA